MWRAPVRRLDLDALGHNDEADQGPASDQTKGLTWARGGHEGTAPACRKRAKIHEKAPSEIAGR